MARPTRRSRVPRAVLVAATLVAGTAASVAADEGWVIKRLDIQYEIRPDSMVVARESIDVDFRGLSKHGIFRDLRSVMDFDDRNRRVYDITLDRVTDVAERPLKEKTTTEDANTRFRIGDPDHTISGPQSYRLLYRIGGALNAFDDHDELYWNATGIWPVTIERATATVHVPAGALTGVRCFQGNPGSRDTCTASIAADKSTATFAATRPLVEGQQMTIVAMLAKNAVHVPPPSLTYKPRVITAFFDHTSTILSVAGTVAATMFGALGFLWWRYGRDRRFVSLHYLTEGTAEERVPLFRSDPIVVEFEPPEKLRPGQVGLLLDERADTLDVTATIIDLAARGYLTITELPSKGWFGKTDWELTEHKPADAALLEYERIVMSGLFRSETTTKLSLLKNKFYQDLSRAKAALYQDAVERKWFPRNPSNVRTAAVAFGVVLLLGGGATTIYLGQRWGAGLLGLPIILGGLLLMMFSSLMPRRTALGREMLRRSLGFMRYIKTAETEQQAFAERASIFTAYLPYAIVFRCVDKWARAFKGVDLQQATAGWYSSTSGSSFNAMAFSSSVSSFSSSVSSAIASTPGGSGGSGSSGSSGGGGGGGGGGSW